MFFSKKKIQKKEIIFISQPRLQFVFVGH